MLSSVLSFYLLQNPSIDLPSPLLPRPIFRDLVLQSLLPIFGDSLRASVASLVISKTPVTQGRTRILEQYGSNMEASMMSPGEHCPRPSTFDPRQDSILNFDMGLSPLSTSALDYSMNYIDANLGFNPAPVTALRLNQFYTNVPEQPFFAPPSFTLAQDIPEVKEARNAVLSIGYSPTIKAEDGSPAKDASAFRNISAHGSPSPVAGQGMKLGTDVDTLMRAIQTKSANRPQRARISLAHHSSWRRSSNSDGLTKRNSTGSEPDRSGQASRKKYQCTMPACAKMFFQKTHLEIHIRAHTGHKPFVRDTCSIRNGYSG